MFDKPQVSVIIPMYNVEKYIRKCLTSVKNQTFTDFEVLMIDDGSPDNSGKIAAEFEKNDKRFTLYKKVNGGLGDARNFGLERAKGKYVVFIDSDDYIKKNYIEILYNECENNGADMACCRFYYTYFNTGICLPMVIAPKKCVLPKQKALKMLIRDNTIKNYAWNKMYRKSLFTENQIYYPNMFFEDIATTGRLMFHSKKVAITNKYLYCYQKRLGSIMSTMNAKKINDFLLSVFIMRNYIQKNGKYNEYKDSLNFLVSKIFIFNIYSVIRMHLLNIDFKNMKRNFRINRYLCNYLKSENYKPVDDTPSLPVTFIQPGKRKNKKKKVSE